MRETLLRYVASHYEQARATSDELRLRALELIVAACVAESRDVPRDSPAIPPVPLPEWSEDDVPKVDYHVLASDPGEVDVEPAGNVEPAWWTSPEEPDPAIPPAEPMRGAWEPPRRS